MCIRKEGSLYRVGSKFYKHDEFWGMAFVIGMVLFFFAMLVVIVIGTIIQTNDLNRILASADPATNLILALDEDPYWDDARMALDEIGDPFLIALAPACEGQAVGGTVYQDDQSGPHPLVFLLPNGKSHHLTYYYLKQWGPESRQVEDVQLVVCVAEIEDELEVCEYAYGGASRTRIQHKITISVVEAATGRTYANHVFEGSVPKNCPSSVPNLDHKEIRGDEVETSKISEYLNELFE